MKISTSNRGMNLESMVNRTIDMYRVKKLALIQKIPTPISPGRLNRTTKKLEGAYFKKKSTVDYIGVVQEIPICFDAKEIRQDKFPLNNIKEHQYDFMKEWEEQGGVSFLLIYFTNRDEVIYVCFRDIERLIKRCKREKRSYILYDELDKNYIIDVKDKITFPFLKKIEMDIEGR